MGWNVLFTNALVVAATAFQSGAGTASVPDLLDASANRDAYRIYEALLPRLWAQENGARLLQQETELGNPGDGCGVLTQQTGDWADAASDFRRQNTHAWVLQPAIQIPYRFVRRADIEADDARLKQRYPGAWMPPGAMEYATVSAVGFNHARTKAIVHVHLRMRGWIAKMEWINGGWQAVETCTWTV